MFINKSLILFTIIFSFLIDLTSSLKCPQNWIDASHMELGCLNFNVTQEVTWTEAQKMCEKNNNNCHLVEIFSQFQQDYISMMGYVIYEYTGVNFWWIGLTDVGRENQWFWSHSLKVADFTNWGSNEPDGNITENYVSMDHGSGFKWADRNGVATCYAICQFMP